jgi:folate-dependent phosphoribosylglycinamide formyltransferase PurN
VSTSYLPIAYFTSCRELHREGVGLRQRGLLDQMAEAPDFSSADRPVVVTDIVVDDDDLEFATAWKTPLWRTKPSATAEKWGFLFEPRLHRVSTKSLRQKQNPLARANRSALRDEIESTLLAIVDAAGCEVGVCDSYMTVFGSRFLNQAKQILINIHPGITAVDHPAKLLGPTPNRDAYTRARFGYIIVDDKARAFWPAGIPHEIEYEGKTRRVIAVPKIAETGVTVHHVEKAVDLGRVIAQSSYHFDPALESEESLRSRNYTLKLPVLKAALDKVLREPPGSSDVNACGPRNPS